VNAPLRRAGIVVLVLFALLFANLNYRQVVMADSYRTNPHNARVQVDNYQHARGRIVNAQGKTIADSQETTDSLKFLRVYPYKDLYAHIVGYRPVYLTPTAVERVQDQFLNGNADSQAADRITALITGKQTSGGNVFLTLDQAAQETALDQLVHNKNHVNQGAIVALDPTTGAMLANVSIPSFDPGQLASHDSAAALAVFNKLDKDPLKPLQNRVFQDTYPPGSTFKVITAAAAETNNPGLTGSTVIKGGDSYTPPQTTTPMKNATGDVCPDQITMKQALTVSCNTAFAQLAVNQIGNDKLKAMAKAFGFENVPKLMGDDDTNYFNVVASHTGEMQGPNGLVDPPALAQSAIGQRDVRETPLQEVMVAAAIANGGKQMQPYIIDSLKGADLSPIGGKTQPKLLRTPITPEVAADLQDMMESVVNSSDGTAVKAQIDGVTVGGKTGTAANGEELKDHGWFIGFAMKDGKPLIAIAVFLQNAGRGGSAEASRIGGEVMKAYINEKGGK